MICSFGVGLWEKGRHISLFIRSCSCMNYVLIVFLLANFPITLQAQQFNLGAVIKPGSELIYDVKNKGTHYTLTIRITHKSGKSFSWIRSAPFLDSGSVQQRHGVKDGDILISELIAGDQYLDKDCSSIWLSRRVYDHFTRNFGKPIRIYGFGKSDSALEMGTFTGTIPMDLLVDGKPVSISAELVECLKREGMGYRVGPDELCMYYYPDPEFPVILGLSLGIIMQLKEVRTN